MNRPKPPMTSEQTPIRDALVLERFVAWLDQVHVAADVVGAA